jgi:MFS family permease
MSSKGDLKEIIKGSCARGFVLSLTFMVSSLIVGAVFGIATFSLRNEEFELQLPLIVYILAGVLALYLFGVLAQKAYEREWLFLDKVEGTRTGSGPLDTFGRGFLLGVLLLLSSLAVSLFSVFSPLHFLLIPPFYGLLIQAVYGENWLCFEEKEERSEKGKSLLSEFFGGLKDYVDFLKE